MPSSVVVIDTGNYFPQLRDGRIAALEAGAPDSTWIAEQLGRPVVKAFNNILAESLREKGARPRSPGRVALSAAGDPPQARAVALRLIDELGFAPSTQGLLTSRGDSNRARLRIAAIWTPRR